MSNYAIQEPEWETTEQGWHAVASLCHGYQWTAYIEYVDATYWRIWAGCMFDSLDSAQAWCHAEITSQIQRAQVAPVAIPVQAEAEGVPTPQEWLWHTLGSELGAARADALRAEYEQRKRDTVS